MARPFKSGVGYFPLDVKLDDEVELLESEHGLIGFGVLIKLYQRIYAHNYWLKWDKKELIVFSKRINVDKNEVIAIINTCLEWGIFNGDLFNDHSILTSHGVQKRFFKITERYKRVEVIEEFLLFNLPEGENKNIVYVDINSVNDCKSTQKKEKETKPNKIKKAKKTSNVFDADSSEMKLSKYLHKVLLKSEPDRKEPNFQNWCKDFDNLIRVQGKKPADIQAVINYAHDPKNSSDKFSWIPNLRSPKKVKEHFTNIFLQAKPSINGQPKQTREMTDEELNDTSD